MLNSSDEDITLYWYGHTTLPSNLSREFVIEAGEKVLLYEASSMDNFGQLSSPPFGTKYTDDSVKFVSISNTVVYIKGDCEQSQNPLCEENYQLLKFVDTKDEKIEEWLFEIVP